MAAILAVAIVFGVVTACIGPLIYFQQRTDIIEREDGCECSCIVSDSVVQIKITQPIDNVEVVTDKLDKNSGDSNTLKNASETEELRSRDYHQEVTRIAPVKPLCNNGKLPKNGVASKMGRCLNIMMPNTEKSLIEIPEESKSLSRAVTTASSMTGVAEEIKVTAQVERIPENQESINGDATKSEREVVQSGGIGLAKSKSKKNDPVKRSSKKASATFYERFLKKLLTPLKKNSSKQSTSVESDETERLNVPSSCRRTPIGHSTMLNRVRHNSISSLFSSRGSFKDKSTKKIDRKDETPGKGKHVTLIEASSSRQNESTEDKIPSVMKLAELRRSRDGKSICDVRISGLIMDRTKFLELSRAIDASQDFVITEEGTSVISIELRRSYQSYGSRSTEDNVSSNNSCTRHSKSLPANVAHGSSFFRSTVSGQLKSDETETNMNGKNSMTKIIEKNEDSGDAIKSFAEKLSEMRLYLDSFFAFKNFK